MEDLTGLQLGQYQVVSPLGEGGMAAVYKAYQPGIERYVALKILPRHLASDPEFYGRFEQEARLIAQLQHVHILPVHDFGEQDGYTYIVMPLIESGTLADLMTGDPLSLKRIRSVTRQVGEALDHAHSRGLIHRDIKPSNILVDEAANCLLTDFGIAKIVASSVQFTRTGAIIGTPAYMSPEQIQGETLDGRSDQYSLGIVMFEMATGRPPYNAETPPAIFVKHLHDPLPMPRELNPRLPEALELVILKCLAKDPEDRYPALSDLLHALARALPNRLIAEEDAVASDASSATLAPAFAALETVREAEHREPQPEAQPVESESAFPKERYQSRDVIAGSSSVGTSAQAADIDVKGTGRRKIPGWAWVVSGIISLGILAVVGWPVVSGSDFFAEPFQPTAVRLAPTSIVSVSSPTQESTPITPTSASPASALAGSDACNDPIGCVVIGPEEPVHIAYMLTISGPTAFLGDDSVGSIEIALDDRSRMLLGHNILLTGEDSLCNAEGGLTAALKLAADPTIVGVIGTNCSSAMTAAMDTITNAGLSIISPSNTAPALTLESGTWKEGYFRVAHSDLFQGKVAAEFAFNVLGARSLATIHDGSPYAEQLQQAMAATFENLGGTVTFQGAINVGESDMRRVLTSVAAGVPDVLYLPVFEPEGDFIVQQSSQVAGLEDTILIGADGLLVKSFPENSGPNAEGMYLSGPYVSGPSYDVFLAKWNVKYGGVPPSGFHAFAYDGTNILLDAIEKVAVQDSDGTLQIGRQALRDAIAATSGFPGLTGTLDCGTKGFAAGISRGDCATGGALGIFHITSAETEAGRWPPDVVWTP